MKSCPYCAEEIQDAAVKCRHCGEFLPEEERAVATGESTESQAQTAPQDEPFFDDDLRDSEDEETVVVQCSGSTQKGERCRRMVTVAQSNVTSPAFCPQHRVSEAAGGGSSAPALWIAVVAILVVALIAIVNGLNRPPGGVNTDSDNVSMNAETTEVYVAESDTPAEATSDDERGTPSVYDELRSRILGKWQNDPDRADSRTEEYFTDGTMVISDGDGPSRDSSASWWVDSFRDQPVLVTDGGGLFQLKYTVSFEGDTMTLQLVDPTQEQPVEWVRVGTASQ